MRLIFVGPDPNSRYIAHPGGQLTAARVFASFSAEHDIALTWIDTAQSSLPPPPLSTRFRRAVSRLWHFTRAAGDGGHHGVLLFAGAGTSFFERSLMVLIGRLLGLRSVLMVVSGHFRAFYADNKALRPVIRRLLNLPYRVGVQGDDWREYMIGIGVEAQRLALVRNWCPPVAMPGARSRSAEDPVRFLFVGWITAAKGVPELLAAARILAERGRAFHLTLIGGGTLLERSRAEVSASGLSDRVCLTGWIDNAALPERLSHADVFVLPSHAEGMPNSLIEAMASGLPAIATPVGAIRDTLEDGVAGTIVPVGDAEALAAAMLKYCDHPSIIDAQSRAARQAIAERHHTETACSALVDLLHTPTPKGAKTPQAGATN